MAGGSQDLGGAADAGWAGAGAGPAGGENESDGVWKAPAGNTVASGDTADARAGGGRPGAGIEGNEDDTLSVSGGRPGAGIEGDEDVELGVAGGPGVHDPHPDVRPGAGIEGNETLTVTEDGSGSGGQPTPGVEGSETVEVTATADSAVAGDPAKAAGEGDEDPGFFDVFTEVSGSGPGDTGPVAGPGSGRAGVRPDDEEPSTLRDVGDSGSAGMEADLCDEVHEEIDDDAAADVGGDLPA